MYVLIDDASPLLLAFLQPMAQRAPSPRNPDQGTFPP